MPRREDIERFKEVLNSLGSEPEIRAEKSELIEEVAPPEEGLPSDINELLGSFAQPLEGAEDAGGVVGATSAELGAEEKAPTAETSTENLDFESLFGEQGEPHAIEDLERAPRRRAREAKRPRARGARAVRQAEEEPALGEIPAGGETPATEETPSAEEFPSIEEFPTLEEPSAVEEPPESAAAGAEELPLNLQADLDQMEVLPADEASGAAATGGQVDEGLVQPAPETEEPSFEGIELPSIEDLEGTRGAAEQAPMEQQAPPAARKAAAVARPPSPIEEFPALESFDLGGAEAAEEPQPAEVAESVEPSGPAEESLSPGGIEGLGGDQLGDLDMGEFDIPEAAEPFGLPAGKSAPRAGLPAAGPKRRAAAPEGRLGGKAREAPGGAARKAAARIAPMAERIAPPRRAGGIEELQAEGAAGAEGAAAAAVELTPDQFDRLKKSLVSLPRNLKIAVQDIITAGRGSGAQIAALVSLLVDGAAAQEIAALAGRITGKRIRVPAGYEKKTGVAFEAERRTFGYALRENLFPVLRLFVFSALAVGLAGFLGYRFVYRPLYAYANYSRGYEHIAADRYSLANERFARAVGVWPRRNWFYRYADAFARRRQFALAEEKYEQLLRRFPGDRKGILDYAAMESRSMANYEKADKLLQQLLDRRLYDYDALLAAGDNYIEWADRDPQRFEDARRSYAALIGKYGQRNELLFRMLRYFIRTDKETEVERLRMYYAERPNVRVDPEAYAELGGYLVAAKRLDYVPDVLFRAMRVRSDLPEIHYALARYYKILNDPAEERKALEQGVLPLLGSSDILTKKRMAIEIDTHTRLGELHYRQQAYIDAEKQFTTAIRLVEGYQKSGLVRTERLFGQPYVDFADLKYYIAGNLGVALANYQKAVDNGYADPELDYKVGYIHYSGGDYEAALESLLAAEQGLDSKRPPTNLLFAIGNAFYQRSDFFAAQGYYLRLLDTLTTLKAAIGILQPEQQPEHRALLEALAKADNNLGVVMVKLAERTGDRRKKSQALVSLTSASETADVLSRVPDTLVRSEAKNLPFLNMRGILYPVSGFELQIYRMIPKDFEALFF